MTVKHGINSASSYTLYTSAESEAVNLREGPNMTVKHVINSASSYTLYTSAEREIVRLGGPT